MPGRREAGDAVSLRSPSPVSPFVYLEPVRFHTGSALREK